MSSSRIQFEKKKKEMTKKLERTPIESLGMELQNIQQSIAGI